MFRAFFQVLLFVLPFVSSSAFKMRIFALVWFFFATVSAEPIRGGIEVKPDERSIASIFRLGKIPFPPPPFLFPPRILKSTNIKNTVDIKPTVVRPAVKACEAYSQPSIDVRILGGEEADESEFPWMAALGYLKETFEISFECGGTIISEFFIVTAAHCASNAARPPIVARLGKISLTDSESVTADNHPIADIITHSNYSTRTKKNDIALIRVAKRIYFSNDIAPACLQTDLIDIQSSVPLLVTGWGKTAAEQGERSNVLLKAQLKTMPLSECNQVLLEWNKMANQAALRDGISQGQYCAYDPQAKNDSCQGDSGGPLQYYPSTGSTTATVLGIVSFGFSCGTELPGVYTRIAHYLDWIEATVWPNP